LRILNYLDKSNGISRNVSRDLPSFSTKQYCNTKRITYIRVEKRLFSTSTKLGIPGIPGFPTKLFIGYPDDLEQLRRLILETDERLRWIIESKARVSQYSFRGVPVGVEDLDKALDKLTKRKITAINK
jgi:hypothetical protein